MRATTYIFDEFFMVVMVARCAVAREHIKSPTGRSGGGCEVMIYLMESAYVLVQDELNHVSVIFCSAPCVTLAG